MPEQTLQEIHELLKTADKVPRSVRYPAMRPELGKEVLSPSRWVGRMRDLSELF